RKSNSSAASQPVQQASQCSKPASAASQPVQQASQCSKPASAASQPVQQASSSAAASQCSKPASAASQPVQQASQCSKPASAASQPVQQASQCRASSASASAASLIYIDSPPVLMEFFPIQRKSFLISLKQQSLTFGYRRSLFGVIAPFSTTTVIIDFPLSVDFLRIQHCEYLHIVIL
ncbi:hypothetical protein DAPPUDRAFT_118225, partial [Daphnia pulex]